MIRRAVMSYWTAPCKRVPWLGWNNADDHRLAWQISSHLLRQHFDEVALVTDDFGLEYLKPLDLPFTEVSLELNSIDPSFASWWSFGKLKAYSMQTVPFIHVDTDAFMFKPLPARILEAPICTQLPEKFSRHKLPGFYRLDEMVERVRRLPAAVCRVVNRPIQYAACCGLYGGNDLGTIKAHWDLINECLRLDLAGWKAMDEFVTLLIFEQWMIGVAVQERKTFIEYLYPRCWGPTGSSDPKQQQDVGFVHLWGPQKREQPESLQCVKDRFDARAVSQE